MDSALARLCAIPGNRDLTPSQAADVLEVCERSLRRMTTPDGEGKTILGCRRLVGGRGVKLTTRYRIQGHGHRILIPRVDIILYLLRHHTRPEDFVACVQSQCPHYLPAVEHAIKAGTAVPELPSNVIPMGRPRRHPDGTTRRQPLSEHPDQMQLFTFPASA